MPDDSLALRAAVIGNAETRRNADPSMREQAAPRRAGAAVLRSLRKEPLLHFCVLGGLIFAADAALHRPAKDERVINVTKARRQAFVDSFDEDRQRVPSDGELQKMIDSWVASEILYREGKALGV